MDGGKGQLSAACRELQRLGLHQLPIIGLAKEHEEIYRPGRALPLQLPEDSGALRLLQRIRDEAHRFANTYHQLLMKKRIGESILDDCPGVSQNRKNILLRRFGSVNRLRRAEVEEIANDRGNRSETCRRSSSVLAAALVIRTFDRCFRVTSQGPFSVREDVSAKVRPGTARLGPFGLRLLFIFASAAGAS